ncbi:MAG: universal stress protein [Hyphomicrobiaceae bacterium]
MYKKVLVPIDLAHKEQAAAMIRTALATSGEAATMTLLFVMPEIPPVLGLQLPAGSAEQAKANAEEQLQELARSNGAPQGAKIVTLVGRPHHKIPEVAEQRGIDLIVMASHQPGLADYLLGSVAANVVRHAKCSVHVMR